jgi:hypothetical protein
MDPRGGVRIFPRLVERDRLLEQRARQVRLAGMRRHLARPVEQRRALGVIVGQVDRLLEVPPRLCCRGQRCGTLAGPHEHALGPAADLCSILRVRAGVVGGEQVRRDHLDHLVLVLGKRASQVRGSGQVPRASLPLGERLVGDVAHEILQEAVLAVLGGARVGLQTQHLLAHERGQHRVDLLVGAGERRQRVAREGLAQHRRIPQQALLRCREAVQPGGDQCMQSLGHLQRLQRPSQHIARSILGEQSLVEQHPHGLDGVQRDALRAGQDAVAHINREAGHETGQQLLHVRQQRATSTAKPCSTRPPATWIDVGPSRPDN